MKKLLFILLFWPSMVFKPSTVLILAGYINTTPGGSYDGACASSAPTTAVYTVDGTVNVGQTITNAAGGSLGISDYNYYAYSATSGGAITKGLQIYAAGYINGTQTCGGGAGGGGGLVSITYDTAYATSSTLVPADYYPMNNGWSRGEFSDSLKNLFDGRTNHGGLPLPGSFNLCYNGPNVGNFQTSYQGPPRISFMVDLKNDSSPTKMSIRDTVTQIVWKEENYYNPKDTIKVYAIDASLVDGTAAGLLQITRADSLLTPLAVLPFSNRNQWDSLSVTPTPARFLMFVLLGHDSTAHLSAWVSPHPGAIRIKGKKNFAATTPFVDPGDIVATTMENMPGKTIASQINTNLFASDQVVRFFEKFGAGTYDVGKRGGYDTMNIAFDAATLKVSFNSFGDGSNTLNDMQTWAGQGKTTILCLRGCSNYLENTKSGTTTEGSVFVNTATSDPERFSSYTRIAFVTKEIARKVGNGTTTDRSHWIDTAYYGGINRNSVKVLEIGNEQGSTYSAQWSPVGYFCAIKVIRDSVNLVDPNMQICGMGTPSQDGEFWKMVWLLNRFYNGGRRLLDWVDYHLYIGRGDDKYVLPYSDVAYHKGASADWDSAYYRADKYARNLKKRFGKSLKIMCGEQGYEETDTTFYGNNSSFTNYSSPVIQGFDVGKSRAMLTCWRMFVENAAGLSASVTYTTVNPSYIEMYEHTTGYAITSVQFAQMGVVWGGVNGPYKTETYYVNSFIQRYFPGFKKDSVLVFGRDTANVYRYRSVNHPDSVIYPTRWGSDSLNTTHFYTIPTKGFVGTPKKMVQALNGTSDGVFTDATTSGNNLIMSLSAQPAWYIMKEAGGSTPPPGPTTSQTWYLYRKQ